MRPGYGLALHFFAVSHECSAGGQRTGAWSARSEIAQEAARLVVVRLMGQLGLAESLEERRHVHAETAPIALTQAVPPADRIVLRAAPRVDGAFLGRHLFLRAPRSTQPSCSTSHACRSSMHLSWYRN